MFSPFTIFEQLVLAMKKRVALKFLTLLNILFTFRIFNNLNLPWKQSFPWKFSLCWKCIFYYSGVLSNFVLPLKNRVALEFFNVLNIPFTFRSFEQLALALWNRGCPEFIVLNIYFLLYRIFEQLALALKNRMCPGIFHCIEIYFIIQDFWATSTCPENRVCPEIFKPVAAADPPDPPPRTPMPGTPLVFFATNVHLDRTHKYHRQTSSDLIRLHQYNTLLYIV